MTVLSTRAVTPPRFAPEMLWSIDGRKSASKPRAEGNQRRARSFALTAIYFSGMLRMISKLESCRFSAKTVGRRVVQKSKNQLGGAGKWDVEYRCLRFYRILPCLSS